mmetsp:Transcript_13561/g.38593  ORF Transcript_13561/g.38593 Transcript_13561/m.38593 type:complete len:592 (-) Transcript_13561:665-2440(-)
MTASAMAGDRRRLRCLPVAAAVSLAALLAFSELRLAAAARLVLQSASDGVKFDLEKSPMKVGVQSEYEAYAYDAPADVNSLLSMECPEHHDDDGGSAARKRLPLALSVVLDKSGSMGGDKIKLLKKTTEYIVTQLSEEDRLGVVAYDSSVQEVLPTQYMTDDAKEVAIGRIKEIDANGSTNLSGGLLEGMSQLSSDAGAAPLAASDPNALTSASGRQRVVRAVLLLTDGQANQGITDKRGIREAMEAVLDESEERVRVFTFGYGSNHDGELLGSIAESGSGRYKFLEHDEALPAAFGEILGGLMATYCIDVEVILRPAPYAAVNVSAGSMPELRFQLLQSTDDNADAAGGVKIDVGDMFAEERKDLVIQLSADAVPSPLVQADTDPLLSVTVKYFDGRLKKEITRTASMALVRPEQVPEDRNPAPWVRYYMMQVKASKKIKEAKQAAAEPCPISPPPMMQAASQAGMPAAATALPSFRGRASQFILPPAPSCDRLAKGRKILEDLLEEIIFEMDQAKTHGDDEEVLGGYRALQGDLKSLLGGFWDQSAYDSRGRLQAAMFSSRSFAVGAAPPPAYMMQAADRAVEYVQGSP